MRSGKSPTYALSSAVMLGLAVLGGMASAAWTAVPLALPGPVHGAADSGAPHAGAPAMEASASVPEPNAGGGRATPSWSLVDARQACMTIWALGQAGEFETAIAVADFTLERVGNALTHAPDPAGRRELRDLRSRLTHLRQTALQGLRMQPRQDGEAGPAAKELRTAAVGDIDPQMNADVQRHIDYFRGRGRETFERWIRRSGRYIDLFRSVLEREGVPSDLVYLVFVESGFNVHARSRAAAVGPWQFIGSTGRLFGLQVGHSVDERRNPEKATVAAARYLKHLHSIFNDWPLALAAYNCGEGRVMRSIRRQGTTNFWDLKLPRQTEEYVPQFMAILHIFHDLEKFGFAEIDVEPSIEFDTIALEGDVDLLVLSRAAGVPLAELRELNPSSNHNMLQGHDGITSVRVPKGTGRPLVDKLHAERQTVGVTVRHQVRSGETLGGIASKYGVSVSQLTKMNGIRNAHALSAGAVLTVPAKVLSPLPVTLDIGDPRGSTAYVPPRNITVPASIDGNSEADGRFTVTVRSGQTLGMIATRYGVSVDDIKRWNGLRSSRVRRGTRLKIRTNETPLGDSALVAVMASSNPKSLIAPQSEPTARIHTVRRGDTLSHIAERYGTTVGQIKRANKLRSTNIRVGQRLKVPSS